jgi:adenosylhomocysteine nucleosidase
MPNLPDPGKRQCSLLFFLATPAEEQGLEEAAKARGIPFERVKKKESPWEEEYHWLGTVGHETVIAIRPVRIGGRLIMGSIGLLGSAARGMRFRVATGAQGIVQLGMAFGIDPRNQKPGDVLVSTSIIPYDNRDVKPAPNGREGYVVEYPQANREPARPELVELFRRERRRGGHPFRVHLGAMLSGAARIHSRSFRDELVRSVPGGDDPIVGGEMEGVGLLAASTAADDPVWCVVKGISDFADEDRDAVLPTNRPIACRNAAEFVLAALVNDAAGMIGSPKETNP